MGGGALHWSALLAISEIRNEEAEYRKGRQAGGQAERGEMDKIQETVDAERNDAGSPHLVLGGTIVCGGALPSPSLSLFTPR